MSLCTAHSYRYAIIALTQPLVEAQARIRANPNFINVSITEPWLRRYQVLPARTHPDMTTSASGGYILHAVRILNENSPDANLASDQANQQAIADPDP